MFQDCKAAQATFYLVINNFLNKLNGLDYAVQNEPILWFLNWSSSSLLRH